MNDRNAEFEIAFGKKVKELRLLRNLTQEELAYLAKIETNQIYRVENAKNGATLRTIVSIATALGKNPQELFDFEFKLDLNDNFEVSIRAGKKRGPKT